MLVLRSMMKMFNGTLRRGGKVLVSESHLDLHYQSMSLPLLILRHQGLASRRVQHLECR